MEQTEREHDGVASRVEITSIELHIMSDVQLLKAAEFAAQLRVDRPGPRYRTLSMQLHNSLAHTNQPKQGEILE